MTKKEKRLLAARIVDALKELYPGAECALEYGGDPWRLLVMGRLSAQCTDARVNIVCKELFTKYRNAEAMANADIGELEAIVRPCGLYRVKAADIKAASEMLIKQYGGILPSEMDELLKFPGVGRKIANLLRGDLFGLPAIVTDTHCIRIGGRLGLYPEKEKRPLAVERILSELIEPAETSDFCHRIVLFGREYCTARAPRCAECPLAGLCKRRKKDEKAAH